MDIFSINAPRTDLADETDELIRRHEKEPDGLESSEEDRGIRIHTLRVTNAEGEKLSGRPVGRYTTADIGQVWLYDTETFRHVCVALSEVLTEYLPREGSCLVAGLGNPHITADAIGNECVDNIIVTRHIRENSPDLFCRFGLRETAAITPDVLGNTGVEAADILRGVVNDIHPGFMIVVDALSCRRLNRLATTVQICDTGILPGSGVNNKRKAINRDTMGVPVIAVGVPTVVSAATLAADLLSEVPGVGEEKAERLLSHDIVNKYSDYYVTPKESDTIIHSTARLVGYAVNHVLHPSLSFAEMADFL